MVEIRVTIPLKGISTGKQSSTVHVASLLYDLWKDYEVYRSQAESIDRNAEPLEYKRSVRSAILAYFAYFEGVLNNWIQGLAPHDKEIRSFGKKIEFIRNYIKDPTRCPFLDIKRARRIRNIIVHPQPTDKDFQLMQTLLDGQFFRDAENFTNWLTLAAHELKLERHPNVPAILDKFSK